MECRLSGRRRARAEQESFAWEREFRKFSVHGTLGVQLAAIQKEAVGPERPELSIRQAGDGIMQRIEIQPLLDPRQGEMRRERPRFARDSQIAADLVEIAGEFCQPLRLD